MENNSRPDPAQELPADAGPTPLRSLTVPELTGLLTTLGQPPFRARQIARWIYLKRVDTFAMMHNIPKSTRSLLADRCTLRKLQVVERRVATANDAVKFGLALVDSGSVIESVLLYDRTRRTLCVSSQLGCALGCTFCATAAMGMVRNLGHEEIIGQVIAANDYLADNADKPLTHIVFMGMGEALANFEAFCSACSVITDPDGFNLAPRRITVSTAGVVPAIERLIHEGPAVNLAVSLNEYNDQRRQAIMPVNRAWPLRTLLAVLERWCRCGKGSLTFEYVVREGENDTPAAVAALTRLLHGLPCKVNCIPLNATSRGSGQTPSAAAVLAFAGRLNEKGITTTVRRSRGADICGACGQLYTASQQEYSGTPGVSP